MSETGCPRCGSTTREWITSEDIEAYGPKEKHFQVSVYICNTCGLVYRELEQDG